MPHALLRASVFLLLAAAGWAASADTVDDDDGAPRREVRELPVVRHESQPAQHSLAEAVRRVERAVGGQILSAERVPFDGRDLTRIKVVDSTGRVRVITDDPWRPPPTRNDDAGND